MSSPGREKVHALEEGGSVSVCVIILWRVQTTTPSPSIRPGPEAAVFRALLWAAGQDRARSQGDRAQ